MVGKEITPSWKFPVVGVALVVCSEQNRPPYSIYAGRNVMPRKSVAQVAINGNIRCQRVYPVENSRKSLAELKTVGLKLTAEQAIHLARALLAASQDWHTIEVTAYRFDRRRQDGTYHITVTTSE